MQIYRIAQEAFAQDLSGKGAWMNGGRWNSEDRFALYTSASRALALLEILAHAPAKMLTIKPYILLTLEVPDTTPTEQISFDRLPIEWSTADNSQATVQLGDQFLQKGRALLLKVPSIIMPEEWNYVLNPLHPEMKNLKTVYSRRITFDKRIF